MILVADESIDAPVVERLRHDGYRVLYVAELSPGVSDDDVLQAANSEGAVCRFALSRIRDLAQTVSRKHDRATTRNGLSAAIQLRLWPAGHAGTYHSRAIGDTSAKHHRSVEC